MNRDEFLDYAILEIDYRVDPELRDDPGGRVERPEKGLLALPALACESQMSWDEAMDALHAGIVAHLANGPPSVDIDDTASC